MNTDLLSPQQINEQINEQVKALVERCENQAQTIRFQQKTISDLDRQLELLIRQARELQRGTKVDVDVEAIARAVIQGQEWCDDCHQRRIDCVH